MRRRRPPPLSRARPRRRRLRRALRRQRVARRARTRSINDRERRAEITPAATANAGAFAPDDTGTNRAPCGLGQPRLFHPRSRHVPPTRFGRIARLREKRSHFDLCAGRAGLYQGAGWTCAEVTGLDLPRRLAAIWGETEYQEAHKATPTGRPSRGPAGLAKAQALGDAPEELHKTQLTELLRRVAAAVEPIVKRQPAPVVLVAEPKIQGHFRELAKWKGLLPDGVLEFPDAMPSEDLHRKACAVFAPLEERMRADALGQLQSLLGNRGKATTEAAEIVKAARYGRVDRLFLCDGQPLWGFFDERGDRVVAHREPAEGDDDLFDYAALMTLRQGGNVTLVDRTQLPPTGPAAAILRY